MRKITINYFSRRLSPIFPQLQSEKFPSRVIQPLIRNISRAFFFRTSRIVSFLIQFINFSHSHHLEEK